MLNSTGDIIYIGMSVNPPARLVYHRSVKPWAAQISEQRILSIHPTRVEAAEEESRLIDEAVRAGVRLHNVAYAFGDMNV